MFDTRFRCKSEILNLVQGAIWLCLFAACQSPKAADTRTPILLDVTVSVVDSSSYVLSADACRRSLENALESEKGWRVLREGEKRVSGAKRVKVRLDKSFVQQNRGTGTTARVFSWLFLGPGYFWIEDHNFTMKCQPSFSVLDSAGKSMVTAQSSREMDVERMFNFHDWNGQVTWYLLSNVAPPFLADPDEETLSESLFSSGSAELIEDIDRGLRGQFKAPVGKDFQVVRIVPELKSPIVIVQPKLGDKLRGPDANLEVAIIDSSRLVQISTGGTIVKAPFLRNKLRFQVPINKNKVTVQFTERELDPIRVQIALKDITPKPKKPKAKFKKATKSSAVTRLAVRRVVPELTTPIIVHSPIAGDEVKDREVAVEIEIVNPESVSFIKIGEETIKAPFKKKRYTGKVPIFNSRGSISLVSVSGELTRVRILTKIISSGTKTE
ncbi:MAG: hypothetical protein P1V97_34255 [Planctomycetota bacterium]|nr:hypothetical protein [Planctomycetota bacterium]